MEDWLKQKIKSNTLRMEECKEMSTSKYYQGKVNAFRLCLDEYRAKKYEDDLQAKADAAHDEWVRDRGYDFEPDINS